jgi:hypothetical protein
VLGVLVKILAAPCKALRLPQRLPARRFVTGAAKAVGIDKRLQQQDRMPELRLPVGGQTLAHQF